jgi:hypothetical protein
MVAYTCNFSYSKDEGRRISSLKPARAKMVPLSQKQNKKNKRAGDIAQV